MRRPKAEDEEGFRRFEKFLEEWSRRDFMKRTGGAAALAAFMAGVPEFLAACGPGGQQAQPAASPVKGGKVIEGSFSDMRHFMSVLVSDTVSSTMSYRCFDGLIDAKANGDLIPAIAKEVPKSPDGVTYTFNLRQDVKWSDGREVTADDVVFTYNLMFDPAYKDVNSPRREDLTAHIESIKATDKFTVVFKTKKVWAPFLSSQSGYGILPKHVLGNLSGKDINTAPFDSGPTVVNGAFKFVKWDKGQQVVLARNDTYYRGAPFLDQFILKVVPDSVALVNQLKTGEVDIGGGIEYSLVDTARAASNLNVLVFEGPSFDYYGYQQDPAKPAFKFFGDKAVRQAMLYALDRQKMVDSVYFKNALLATGFEPTVSWAYSPNVKPKYTYDKKKAEDLLDAAGWRKGASGIREKDGVPMKFEMLTNVGNKARENLLVVMQQQWKDIGIDASPKPIQFQQLVTQLTNQRTFDLFLLGFSLSIDPDQSQIWGSASAAPGGFNGMPYKNPEVDRLFDDAVSTLDQNKRKEIYNKIQDIFNDDAVAPILTYPKSRWALNKRVQNAGFGTFNQFSNRPWMKDVFVTDGK